MELRRTWLRTCTTGPLHPVGALALPLLLAVSIALPGCGTDDGGDDGRGPTGPTSTSRATTTGPARGALHEAIEERSTTDREDDIEGHQVHVLYVLPADGTDAELDIDGTIARSVALTDDWIAEQIGRRLRLDTHAGRLDITYHRLTGTAAEYEAAGVFIRDEIERDVIGSGFDRPNVIYAAYYAGPAEDCASAFWPDTLPGNMVGLYWVHAAGGSDCAPEPFRAPGEGAGLWEHSLAHELFHAFGAAPRCAANHTREGHVSDTPSDLMYAGDEQWLPSEIDAERDDYVGHGRPGCFDLLDSPWLEPA